MIPLRILTLVIAGNDCPSILVLQPIEDTPPGKARIVPLWVGYHEAYALSLAIEATHLPRPITHDLMLDALTNLDARVDHVLIHKAKGRTFFATLYLRQGNRLIAIDARPTDALALAIRQDAPFYMDEELLARRSFPYLFHEDADEAAEIEEFRVFLEGLDPEDFADLEKLHEAELIAADEAIAEVESKAAREDNDGAADTEKTHNENGSSAFEPGTDESSNGSDAPDGASVATPPDSGESDDEPTGDDGSDGEPTDTDR